VKWETGLDGGKTLLHCHACKREAPAAVIAEALGLQASDLFDEPLPPRERFPQRERAGRSVQQRKSGARRGKLGRLPARLIAIERPKDTATHVWEHVTSYPYTLRDGQLVQEVVRKECTSCRERHKDLVQGFIDSRGKRVDRKPQGFTAVPYRLPEVAAAIAAGQRVFIFEGEKDADRGAGDGLASTTNPGGAGSFPKEWVTAHFGGADAAAVLDRDHAGYVRGLSLHDYFTEAGQTLQLFLPATTEEKSDYTDHRDAGHGLDELIPVLVDEVAAWSKDGGDTHPPGTVGGKHTAIEDALAETQARLAAAAESDDPDEAKEHKRLAERWALEAEIRYEELQALVEDTQRLADAAGTPWAAEAVASVHDRQRQALTAARTAFTTVGLPVPPLLQDTTPAAVAKPSTADQNPAVDAREQPATPSSAAALIINGRWSKTEASPRRRAGAAIEQPIYRIHDGCIVQIDSAATKKRRETAPEDADESDVEVLKLVLGLDVRILQMEYLENVGADDVDIPQLMGREGRAEMEALNPPAPAELSAVVIEYTHPATDETMQMRIPADDYRDGKWLESLPGPPAYDSRPSGMARLRDAIKAVSGTIRITVRFRTTGWRRHPDTGEWMFIHAGGAITAHGYEPAPVLLTGPMARYDLPDPSTDPARIREVFLRDTTALLSDVPGRVAAPLLGHAFRSALGPCPWVFALVGSPGSYKTSIASLTMHYWGELWDRRKPASSMSGNGDTLNALRIKLSVAKDALYWADDVAPTKDWMAAQKLLEEFARMVHNSEARDRSSRDGQGTLDGTAPRASALVTSEVMPRPGSGARRLFPIPLRRDEVDLEALKVLDRGSSRHGRALLFASFLRWLAGDLRGRREQLFDEVDRYSALLRTGGESDSVAEAVANTWAGWAAMLAFLQDVGALSAEEADKFRSQIDAHMQEALVATVDPDLPTRPGQRVRELLVHSLRTGLAYVDDVRTGDAPPWPLAGRLGWRRTQVGVDEIGQPKYKMEARGIRLGYVMHDPGPKDGDPGGELRIESTALEQVLKAAGQQMSDGLQVDRGTAIRYLYDEGILVAEHSKTTKAPRFTVKRTLHCEHRWDRMTTLRLTRLLGVDAGEEGRDEPPPTPPDDRGPEPAGAAPADLFTDHAPPVDSSQQAGLLSAPPQPGLTSPPPKEHDSMRTYADAEGTAALAEHMQGTAPCVLCDTPAGVRFAGQPAHIPCWEKSTAATRAAAIAARARRQDTPAETAPVTASAGTGASPAQSAAPPRASSSPMDFVAPAAVLHTDGVWFPDGRRVDLPGTLRHVGHIAELVYQLNLGTQVTQYRAAPGQMWVTREMTAALGIDPDQITGKEGHHLGKRCQDLTRGSALVTEAIDEGWQLGGRGDCLNSWTRVWRGEQRGVWVALIAAMPTGERDMPFLKDNPSPATLARRIALLAGALHAPWAMSGSTTGFNHLDDLRWKNRKEYFQPYEPVPPALVSELEREWNWSRHLEEHEANRKYLHLFDRGGSHAAGMAGLEVGIGEPEHHPDGCAFDPKLPGYHLIEVPEIGDARMPHPLKPTGKVRSLPVKPIWVTTPTLQLAYEMGYEVPVLESYTWAKHGRVFDPLYTRWREARASLDVEDADSQIARDQLKVIYTRTVGMMASETYMGEEGAEMRGVAPGAADGGRRRHFAPDRRHHIVAKARCNILRRVLQIGADTGQWPVAVWRDTILYVSDEPEPAKAWPGTEKYYGRGFGQYKPEGTLALADYARFFTGDGFSAGMQHIEQELKAKKLKNKPGGE
jgi:hypothetical protein